MGWISEVLKSDNGVAVAIIIFIALVILLIFGKKGFFSYNRNGFKVGRTETETRAILLKQKEFLLQYCSYLTQVIITDLKKRNIQIDYISADYVVEKVVDEWLGWLLVNHITLDEPYIFLKTQQSNLIMLKAIGRVNKELLEKKELIDYFKYVCETSTKEIVKGVLDVYNMESK